MFGFGEKKFVGIDIGTSSIKVAEIKIKEKKPFLSNYAMLKIPISNEVQEQNFSEDFLAGCLKKLLKEGKISNGQFFFSIQSFGALITIVNLPQVPEKDMEQAIQFEAHKYIPTSLDQVSLSWGIIGKENKNSESGNKVLLVAAPKSRIEKYGQIAKKAGIGISAMEIESFSLVRSLIGNDSGKFLIIDIGSRVCNIILVEKGEIRMSRNIDAGGKDITRSIASGLSVDESRAENLKSSKMDFLGVESNVQFPCLDLILGEVKRVLMSQNQKDFTSGAVDGIILSGGTANLAGLEKYFSDALKIKTQVGNPFGRIQYNPKLEERIKEIAPRFSVAIGLALKGIEKK